MRTLITKKGVFMDEMIEVIECHGLEVINEILKPLEVESYKDLKYLDFTICGYGSRLGGTVFETFEEAYLAQFGYPADMTNENDIADAYNKLGDYYIATNTKNNNKLINVFEEEMIAVDEFISAMDSLVEEYPKYAKRKFSKLLADSEALMEELENLE